MSADILSEAGCLLAVGCFCIGTNQVDCDTALSKGVIFVLLLKKLIYFGSFRYLFSIRPLVIVEVSLN